MGECQYALKARFPKGKLRKIFPDILTFWKQGQAARDWWQEHRDRTEEYYDKDKRIIPAQMAMFKEVKATFWNEFKARFPLVVEMLKGVRDHGHTNGVWSNSSLVLNHDPRNGLGGVINFGQSDDEPEFSGDILCFSSEVSHSADWNPIAKFLKKKYKARAVKWVSEEDTSLSDFLDV